MNLGSVQKRIIQNKIKKGFNTTDIEKEFRSLQSELDEALDAYRNKSIEDVAEELADVAIFTLGIAQLLGIDMEKAIESKMVKNENRVYVKDKNGEPVKLGAVFLPSGKFLGTPFAKVALNEYGDVSIKEMLESVERLNKLYFPYPYTEQDLGEVGLVRFGENGYEIESLFDVDIAYQDEMDNPNIPGKMLTGFFKIDESKVAKEDVEFVLLFRLDYNSQEAVEDISYYMTYLNPDDSFINSMIQKGENL